MVRDATYDDVEKLLPLAYVMHQTSIYKETEYDEEVVRKYAKHFVDSENNYFRVVDKDGKPCAFFLGYITTYLWSNQTLACEENLFTDGTSVLAGLKLTKDFEAWAKEKGAYEVNFSITHSGKPDEQMNKFMVRMGYQERGAIFKKRI